MKYAGLLLMAVSVSGAGFLAAEQWQARLKVLLTLRQMIFALKGEILHSRATLPEAFLAVGGRCGDGALASLFVRTGERMAKEPELPFYELWQQEIAVLPDGCSMTAEDRRALLAAGEHLGYADISMQERTLLFYLEELDGAIGFLRKETAGRMKLYRSLGVAAGLFLLILMG